MQCPKCNHIQAEARECRKCGVIFAKYEAYEKHRKELAKKQKEKSQKRTSSAVKYTQLLFLIAAVAGVTYYFTASKVNTTTQEPTATVTPADGTTVDPVLPAIQQEKKAISQDTIPGKAPMLSASSPVDFARRATVSVETPWGTGSGFFIEKNHIVTNRHVVEFNENDLKVFKDQVRTNRKLIDLEEQKIEEMRQSMEAMEDGPTKSQLEIIIKEREKYLAQVEKQQRENERRLLKLEREAASPEIKIILSDGTEHTIGYMLTSENYDLALLSLYSHDGEYLRRPPAGQPIHQGDKVYTVGSPVGLRHTVTAGVFSGYRQREEDNQVFLQTDAAINPGNSGGPLIDEKGYVRGVNTMILKNTEGIGFAIPIDKVFEEFSTTLE